MLSGVQKRRKGDEELDSDGQRGGSSDDCKDVGIVSSFPSSSSSGHRSREQTSAGSRARSPDEDSSEGAASVFEFQKGHRPAVVPPFSKPTPSKWDDAQKWIASRPSRPGAAQNRTMGPVGHNNKHLASKVVMEVEEEEEETKRVDAIACRVEKEVGGRKIEMLAESCPAADSCAKAAVLVEKSVAGSAIKFSQHDSSISLQSATTLIAPPSTVRSVSMRDMGTEMTPIASQEPSRTGTPTRSTTPLRSPSSSQPSTPRIAAPNSTPVQSADCHRDHSKRELSEKELQIQTRREIMLLGTQLGKTNITAWASKEEEELDASVSLKTLPVEHHAKSSIDTRATAWEEAEKARYLARFKREEIKIQAWENHQTAKTEAEMRKIEVEIEKMRARAHDRLMNKLAAARHKAEEKHAAADARKNEQAARTAGQAEYIRKTGRVPSPCCCWCWCS